MTCPGNYTSIGDSCFLFLNDDLADSWSNANEKCQGTGGHLATLADCAMFANVVRYIHVQGKDFLHFNFILFSLNRTYSILGLGTNETVPLLYILCT